ncbi:Tetrahydromethanopterin S-methyltransferase subunit D [Methanocaldococcus lauensis]|uniref:Tetrahydromethanopterin S-methyltransferase subunit D n=1 Tax=Methanocaldococcus lauensis TaxID=2546128 RepID=A0A8D6PUG3_9EURY|nr:tetrahydromethanopterin S-methyltransferase subunit D [Methanocaldococcus lauensis]CAB3287708.1 Tetrahydromethanopterin S-methyltransferase subunit D [Methanocaldococcus lauensis]CAB3290185.1 Tetrahydromethanopterin S-methyltransferase subunit D [Methanocaldococcus lauensis]
MDIINLAISLIEITIAGAIINASVHFVPVGGAPAAMATSTGVGTGTTQLAAGAGFTGLMAAAVMSSKLGIDGLSSILILLSGAIGSMIMLGVTMLIGQLIYVFGVGVVPAADKCEIDPITKDPQKPYITPGTTGHGIPTVCFISGLIGAALGGIGGALAYIALINIGFSMAVAGILAVGFFFINAVLASYNIGGTIEGFHDPKFKKMPNGVIASTIASFVCGIVAVLMAL